MADVKPTADDAWFLERMQRAKAWHSGAAVDAGRWAPPSMLERAKAAGWISGEGSAWWLTEAGAAAWTAYTG